MKTDGTRRGRTNTIIPDFSLFFALNAAKESGLGVGETFSVRVRGGNSDGPKAEKSVEHEREPGFCISTFITYDCSSGQNAVRELVRDTGKGRKLTEEGVYLRWDQFSVHLRAFPIPIYNIRKEGRKEKKPNY